MSYEIQYDDYVTDIKLPVRKSVQSCDDQKRNLCEEEEEYYQNQHQGGVAGISSTLLPMAGIQAEIGEEGEKSDKRGIPN